MGERPQRLPPGRHGFSRGYVSENQRARILAATARAAAEQGYPDLTVETVIARARVSRKTFYQYFKNKEEAFLAAYDDSVARLMERVNRGRADSGTEFTRRAEATLDAVLEFLAEHPAEAKLLIVEVLAAGPRAVRRRNDSLRLIVDLVDRSTCALADERGLRRPPAITAETVVGGMLEVLYSRIERDDTARLPELLPDLLYCALLPYLGPSAAGAEHARLAASTDRTGTAPGP